MEDEEYEELEYRGELKGQPGSSLVTCSGWDEDGYLVRFAADYRMMLDREAGDLVLVPRWAILSRRPAFETDGAL